MDAQHKLAYACECEACGVEPGALCQRLTTRTTMTIGNVHPERLNAALELHRRRHPASSHPNDPNPGYAPVPVPPRDTLELLAHQAPAMNECRQCGQASTVGLDARGLCAVCVDLERAPQGAQDRLFTPAPAVMAGQEGMF